MNIRDIRQYIKNICGEYNLDLLGTSKEAFLQKLYGTYYAESYVEAIIEGTASFASNAEEQLFYEFVQNAYDANANSLFFYANEDYLIVLNNGEPFYTDISNSDSDKVRNGQLYDFLGKGKSRKREDIHKLGNYGQGSKLLYTLIPNVSNSIDNKSLLIEAVYNNKKGPYLISWYNRNQIANILQERGNWVPAQADDYKNNILFVKILMSYFPVAPGSSEELFSNQEALDAIKAFDTLVDPRRNLHFLDRGTAIIIPLGKGKYERIISESNLERVRIRLGGFASITKNMQINAGKTIDHIYVMGEEIEQHDVQSVFVEFEVEGNKFEYHFAFNPVFVERNFVNLFKGLPILETKLQLGFIIDSQKFDVDDSRQRIIDKEKTRGQLARAFAELVKELRKIKESDPTKFDYIYKAIAASRYLDGEDSKYIKDAFQEVFVPFFEEFVLTSTGEYEHQSNVREFEEDLQIPLNEIGITKYKWISPNIAKELHRHKISPEKIGFSTLINDAESNMLSAWIKSLSAGDYENFFKLLDSHKTESDIINIKLFRTNKRNLYSYNELKSTVNVYYPYEENMKFGDCEHINEILSDIDENSYRQQLLDKIKTNIESFRLNDSTIDDAANLLAWIGKDNEYYTKKIRHDIPLLQNWYEEYVSFDDLLSERPKDTILFDNYTVKGYVPEVVKENNWILSPDRAPKACWQWVVNHWDDIQEREDWGGNTHKYIADIKSVYNTATNENSGIKDAQKLTLYLDEDGIPSKKIRTVINNVSKLSEEEYNYISKKVVHLCLLPYEYYKELMEDPFKVETVQSADIVNDGLQADEKLLRVFIKITDAFLKHYRTQEKKGKYVITKASGANNYIDSVSEDLQSELLVANFYHIPNKVQEILPTVRGDYRFATNHNMLIKAIEKISNPIKLLPFVKQANVEVKNKFFSCLKEINIDSKITKEDLRWQVIVFAVQSSDEENNYINTVFKIIRHNTNELPSSITQQFVKIGNNEYDIYDLDENYKNDNLAIDSFLNCLPSSNEMEYFKEHYYDGKEEEISAEDIYQKLKEYYLTIEQLRFCIDYAIANDDDYNDLEIEENESLTDALDMILSNNFVGFEKYFKIKDLDFNIQIYANHKLLLENEYLPNDLQEWLDKNPTGINLFTKLTTSDNPFIAVRQALLDNTPYNDILCFSESEKTEITDRTIDWIIGKKLTYEFKSNRFYTMMAVIERLPDEYDPMPFLRYTGNVAAEKDDNDETLNPIFTLERFQDGGAFLSYYSWAGEQFLSRLSKSRKLSNFIKDNIVYYFKGNDVLLNHGYKKESKWIVQTSVDVQDFPEYDDPVYRKWKGMKESQGITIHTSQDAIAMNFNIVTANVSIFTDKMKDSEFGYEPGKRIVIQQPNKEGLSLMKTIAKHIANMEFFKEPFIFLQSLYVDEWELSQQENNSKAGDVEGKPNIDLSESKQVEDQAQKGLNKISTETAANIERVNNLTKQMNGDDLEKLNDLAEPIKELMNGLGKENIERLASQRDKLLQMMENLEEAEEEEKESQVRQTIGFIGELIYACYLDKKGKKYVHAALEGVGDYDFEVKTDKMYVDVKTTLYSLKDGTAPFYLHRSQNKFMKKHPESKYHIVRISLFDLNSNLKKAYEELRDTYGKDANPIENLHLRKECELIAKRYWAEAKIEEFDALSPEYAIRIEQKIK